MCLSVSENLGGFENLVFIVFFQFRLANEGLPSINHLMGQQRRLSICKEDLIVLLQNNNPLAPPLLDSLTEETQKAVETLGE